MTTTFKLFHGNSLEVLPTLPESSIDSIVCDPPYGLSFMGRKWDYDVPTVGLWRECLRVLKPGGHLLAFAGTRTQHRMCCNIEDAGFEIRDMLAWVYGSGFPKSLDVSKAIDKAAGAERDVVGTKISRQPTGNAFAQDDWTKTHGIAQPINITAPATDEAKQWQGWGTALKPSLEPITLARKPFRGTVASNVLQHGTGAVNIDGCRIDYNGETPRLGGRAVHGRGEGYGFNAQGNEAQANTQGRWPANLLHDGSTEVADLLGAAARFFYCAKASKADRNEGCEAFPLVARQTMGSGIGGQPDQNVANNNHPTVKPTDLMRYLCRLVTPPGGVCLDPFTGSGSTGKAAMLDGFEFIGIEMDEGYVAIARARIEAAQAQRAE